MHTANPFLEALTQQGEALPAETAGRQLSLTSLQLQPGIQRAFRQAGEQATRLGLTGAQEAQLFSQAQQVQQQAFIQAAAAADLARIQQVGRERFERERIERQQAFQREMIERQAELEAEARRSGFLGTLLGGAGALVGGPIGAFAGQQLGGIFQGGGAPGPGDLGLPPLPTAGAFEPGPFTTGLPPLPQPQAFQPPPLPNLLG